MLGLQICIGSFKIYEIEVFFELGIPICSISKNDASHYMSPYLSTCPELASSPKESRNEMYLELAEQKAEKAQYEYW